MDSVVRRTLFAVSVISLLGIAAATASAQTSKFETLARPKFTNYLRLEGCSADCSVVLATYDLNSDGYGRPVVWDASGAVKILDVLPYPGHAGTKLTQFERSHVSADGSVIGGYCQSHENGFESPPVVWDAASGAIRKLPSPWNEGDVRAVSPNGAFLYGWCRVPPVGDTRPFRWNTAGEATILQTLSGGDVKHVGRVVATSFDGTIAVGTDAFPVENEIDFRPVRWKADGSVEALPLLGTDVDGHTNGEAYFCSSDGSIVIGQLEKYTKTGAMLEYAYVCWPGDGTAIELPGSPMAITPDAKTLVGDCRMDLVDGKYVRTELGFTDFGGLYAQDVSDDGHVMAGLGTGRSDYPGALVWIDGRMYFLEQLLNSQGVSLPEGWESLDSITYCSSDGTVFVGEGTFGDERTAFRVTIPDILADREPPVFAELVPIRAYCDPGRTFATIKLKTPKATDNAAGKVRVTTNAKSQFKIGTTTVVWTATDASGNKATAKQKVTVVNRKPKANAGKAIVVTTKSEKGIRVTLDGSKSSDPDKHKLKYAWSAKGVQLSNKTTAKPAGVFKPGKTMVTLTVTDIAGAKSTAKVSVTVKLKNAKPRPRGADANRSFAVATRQAQRAVEAKTVSGSALSGLAYANAAAAFGDAAGEYVRWEDGQTEADAVISYADLRSIQRQYGQSAASALLSAYAETGDESLLTAYASVAYGTAAAEADLAE